MKQKKKKLDEEEKIEKKVSEKEKVEEKLDEEVLSEEFDEFDDEDLKKDDHSCGCGCNCCSSNDNKAINKIQITTGITLCISIVVLLVSLFTLNKVMKLNGSDSNKEGNETTQEAEYDVSMFKEITAKEFVDMFKKKDDKRHYIYTGTSSCSFCIAFLPFLQKSVEEYDYTLYYLDVAKVTQEEMKEIQKLDDKFEEFFGYTPMVFVTKNAEVRDVNEGYVEYETYAKFLEENKVSKK